ncbi:MAG: DUF433 domain-containing protein [Candidatus Bathyarchaeota archaeon]|jgi:uncharacterized protein (DUF433 family)|nr:DUF433 domain-containing protein [Candidatus Bathyarchaeota archaeon]
MEKFMERIAVDQEILGGKPVIKGTRIPIYLIVELLGNGLSEKEVLWQYPDLKEEDIKAALLYASKCLENEVIITL